MSPASIQGSEKPVAKIFSDDYVFTIPNYQRPYAWTTEEAGELVDDLLNAMEDGGKPVEELNPYFLGSVVLIKDERSPDAQIVDGQQRLVTLIILLSAIRALVGARDAENVTKRIYEKGDSILGTPNRYRLAVRERDNEFFQKYIQNENGIEQLKELHEDLSDSCRNMRENALLFLSRLEALTQEQRVFLARFMALQCYLVLVSTPDLNSAYRIFSVLNDRGLELSLTDILKAEIIGKIGKSEEEEYTRKWEDTEDNLGRDAFADLFAHIRMIFARKKLRSTVLQEFREFVNPTEDPRAFIESTLLPTGEVFDQIRNASYESATGADEINRFLKYLNRIDNFDWQPPAILYMTRNRKPKDLLEFIRKLERLAAGMMMIRADINYRLERYGRLLSAIEEEGGLFVDDSPLQLTSSEQRQIIGALNGDIYRVVKIRLPVLLRLDEALSEGEATYDYPIITVEHVLPQSPEEGSQWLEWWPDDEEREGNVHRLGNLALLSRRKNSQAQNFEFERKKREYFQRRGVAPFALTTQVLNEQEWTRDVVMERQKQLVEKLKEVWDLSAPRRRALAL